MSRRPASKPQTAQAVAKGLAALGVGADAQAPLAFGLPAAVVKALPNALSLNKFSVANDPADLEGDYDLIVVGDGLTVASLGETHNRLAELALRLRSGGEIAVWLGTFAAPLDGADPASAFDALLFPESAAAGVLGPQAQRATLSASGWMMMVYALGFECVAQAGVGEGVLPDAVAVAHATRLAAFDPTELNTGRFLARFRRRGEAQ